MHTGTSRIKRRSFLGGAISLALDLPIIGSSIAAGESQSSAASPTSNSHKNTQTPNLILIVADDLGWGDLGCFGHPVIKTPCLDRLSSNGCRLTSFYVTTPVCAPSRAAILTGRDPNCFGMKFLCNDGRYDAPIFHHVPLEQPFLPRFLREQGYLTGHVGKWHLSLADLPGEPTPQDYGFDYSFIMEPKGKGMYRNPSNWSRNNQEVPGVLAEWTPNLLTDESIDFIQSCHGQPFSLNLWLYSPHEDVESPLAFQEQFDGRSEREKLYYGAVTHMDRELGRLLNFLENNDLISKTVLLFISDNGPEHPLLPWVHRSCGSTGPFRGSKHSLYEGGIRVPGILHWPGVTKAGSVCSIPLSSLDILPTMVRIAGVPALEEKIFDGVDLRLAFVGKEIRRPQPLYWQYDLAKSNTDKGQQFNSPIIGLREGPWKLLSHDVELTQLELYNLEFDLGEKWDVKTLYPGIAQELREKMLQKRDLIKSEFPE